MRRAPGPRLLILDCDGVLIRSEAANLAYYNHIFLAHGVPPVAPGDRAAVERLHTLSTPQVLDAFLPPSLRAAADAYAAALDYAQFLPYLEAEPGWDAVLEAWRRRGPVAVATNRGASARAVLEAVGLLRYLDLVVTIRDVARPKPSPDVLLRVLDHFSLAPGDALYVGDSGLDQAAARAAGVPFLGFRRAEPPSVTSAWQVGALLAGLDAPATLGAAPT